MGIRDAYGINYRTLALPYLPEFSIGDLLVGADDTSQKQPNGQIKAFQRLADALTLMADPSTRLGQEQSDALARLLEEPAAQPTSLQADTSRRSAGYDAYVDYGDLDRDIVQELTQTLNTKGSRIFLPSHDLRPGMDWKGEFEQALEYSASVLICFGKSANSPFRTLVLEKARRTTRTRIIPILLPGAEEEVLRSFGLEYIQCIDLRHSNGKDSRQSIDELNLLLKRQSPNTTAESKIQPTRNPYVGETPYSEDDAQFFHGREEEVSQLLRAINEFHLVLLEGPAKVGKTSLVNAGLLPQLRRQWPDQNTCMVGRIALLDAAGDTFDAPPWIQEHAQDQIPAKVESMDVCIIDNLDTYCGDVSVCEQRLKLIQDTMRRVGPTLRLLLVWRGTFPDNQYQALRETWKRAHFKQLTLTPLERENLRRGSDQIYHGVSFLGKEGH